MSSPGGLSLQQISMMLEDRKNELVANNQFDAFAQREYADRKKTIDWNLFSQGRNQHVNPSAPGIDIPGTDIPVRPDPPTFGSGHIPEGNLGAYVNATGHGLSGLVSGPLKLATRAGMEGGRRATNAMFGMEIPPAPTGFYAEGMPAWASAGDKLAAGMEHIAPTRPEEFPVATAAGHFTGMLLGTKGLGAIVNRIGAVGAATATELAQAKAAAEGVERATLALPMGAGAAAHAWDRGIEMGVGPDRAAVAAGVSGTANTLFGLGVTSPATKALAGKVGSMLGPAAPLGRVGTYAAEGSLGNTAVIGAENVALGAPATEGMAEGAKVGALFGGAIGGFGEVGRLSQKSADAKQQKAATEQAELSRQFDQEQAALAQQQQAEAQALQADQVVQDAYKVDPPANPEGQVKALQKTLTRPDLDPVVREAVMAKLAEAQQRAQADAETNAPFIAARKAREAEEALQQKRSAAENEQLEAERKAGLERIEQARVAEQKQHDLDVAAAEERAVAIKERDAALRVEEQAAKEQQQAEAQALEARRVEAEKKAAEVQPEPPPPQPKAPQDRSAELRARATEAPITEPVRQAGAAAARAADAEVASKLAAQEAEHARQQRLSSVVEDVEAQRVAADSAKKLAAQEAEAARQRRLETVLDENKDRIPQNLLDSIRGASKKPPVVAARPAVPPEPPPAAPETPSGTTGTEPPVAKTAAEPEGAIKPKAPSVEQAKPNASPAEQPAAKPRLHQALRQRIEDMSPEEQAESIRELRAAAGTDRVTGAPNLHMLDAAEAERPAPVKVSYDVDSLKWVNDQLGHRSGDVMLKTIADAFRDEGLDAYHIHGDEFVSRHFGDSADADAAAQRVLARLRDATVEVKLPDGTTVTKKGFGFSHGIGDSLEAADAALGASKDARLKAGERAGRGAEPPGVARKPAERVADNADSPAEAPAEVEPAWLKRLGERAEASQNLLDAKPKGPRARGERGSTPIAHEIAAMVDVVAYALAKRGYKAGQKLDAAWKSFIIGLGEQRGWNVDLLRQNLQAVWNAAVAKHAESSSAAKPVETPAKAVAVPARPAGKMENGQPFTIQHGSTSKPAIYKGFKDGFHEYQYVSSDGTLKTERRSEEAFAKAAVTSGNQNASRPPAAPVAAAQARLVKAWPGAPAAQAQPPGGTPAVPAPGAMAGPAKSRLRDRHYAMTHGGYVSTLGEIGRRIADYGLNLRQFSEAYTGQTMKAIGDAIKAARALKQFGKGEAEALGRLREQHDLDADITALRARVSGLPDGWERRLLERDLADAEKARKLLGYNPSAGIPMGAQGVVDAFVKNDDHLYGMFEQVALDDAAGRVKNHWAHRLKPEVMNEIRKGPDSQLYRDLREHIATVLQTRSAVSNLSRADALRDANRILAGEAELGYSRALSQIMGNYQVSRKDLFGPGLIDWSIHGMEEYFRDGATAVMKYANWATPDATGTKLAVRPQVGMETAINDLAQDFRRGGSKDVGPVDVAENYLKFIHDMQGGSDVGMAAAVVDPLVAAQAITKLARPTTQLKNITQPLAVGSMISLTDQPRAIGLAIANVLRMRAGKAEMGKALRAGAIPSLMTDTAMREQLRGSRMSSRALQFIQDKTLGYTQTPVEVWNNMVVQTLARKHVQSLVDIMRGGHAPTINNILKNVYEFSNPFIDGPREAERMLKDWYRLSDEQIAAAKAHTTGKIDQIDTGLPPLEDGPITLADKAGYMGATEVNFRGHPDFKPVPFSSNNPLIRAAFQFKTFPYNVLRQIIKKPAAAAAHGNVRPALTMFVGAYLAGQFINLAVTEGVQGKEDMANYAKTPTGKIAAHVIDRILQSGLVSMFDRPADWMDLTKMATPPAARSLVAVSLDAANAGRRVLGGSAGMDQLAGEALRGLERETGAWKDIESYRKAHDIKVKDFENAKQVARELKPKLTEKSDMAERADDKADSMGRVGFMPNKYDVELKRLESALLHGDAADIKEAAQTAFLRVSDGEATDAADTLKKVRASMMARSPLAEIDRGSKGFDAIDAKTKQFLDPETTHPKLKAFADLLRESGNEDRAKTFIAVHAAYVRSLNLALGDGMEAVPKEEEAP